MVSVHFFFVFYFYLFFFFKCLCYSHCCCFCKLEEAVEASTEISVAFSDQVLREVEFFKVLQVVDWRCFLMEYAQSQYEFYQKV